MSGVLSVWGVLLLLALVAVVLDRRADRELRRRERFEHLVRCTLWNMAQLQRTILEALAPAAREAAASLRAFADAWAQIPEETRRRIREWPE